MHQKWTYVAGVMLGMAMTTGVAADTTLTYQGELKENGGLANGSFNLEVSLWDAVTAGSQIGSTIMFNGLPVSDGRFTVGLDFGATAFDNADRWLEIGVNGSELAPRQPITPALNADQSQLLRTLVPFQNMMGDTVQGTSHGPFIHDSLCLWLGHGDNSEKPRIEDRNSGVGGTILYLRPFTGWRDSLFD